MGTTYGHGSGGYSLPELLEPKLHPLSRKISSGQALLVQKCHVAAMFVYGERAEELLLSRLSLLDPNLASSVRDAEHLLGRDIRCVLQQLEFR